MAIPKPRFAPLRPWQLGWLRYLLLWLGGALAVLLTIWFVTAAIGQPDLPIGARVVVMLIAGFTALLTLGALDALLTGGARAVTGTSTDDGIVLTRADETTQVPWSRLDAAAISVRTTRYGDRGAALDLWLNEAPSPELEALGTWVTESAPADGLPDRRLRIDSIGKPTLRVLSSDAARHLDHRWLGRCPGRTPEVE